MSIFMKPMESISAMKSDLSRGGFSFVEVILGVGILSVLTMISADLISNNLNAFTSIQKKGDVEAIRRTILNRISCTTTVERTGGRASCDGSLIDVYDNFGSVFIKKDGTKFGDWTLRGLCSSNGLVFIQIARLRNGAAITTTSDADFHFDRMNHEFVYSWANMEKRLFPSGISPCPQSSSVTVAISDSSLTPVPTAAATAPSMKCSTHAVYTSKTGTAMPKGQAIFCPNATDVMTQCVTLLSTSGDQVCASQVIYNAKNGHYCAPGGCNSVEGRRWYTEYVCCN